uniref:Putative transforming growth factor-beta n=1 Tax=Ixodes ricinus TaxID=34613 RepID=A0A147BCL4_IXORI
MRVPVLVVVAARLLLAAAVPATTTRTTRHELSNAIEDVALASSGPSSSGPSSSGSTSSGPSPSGSSSASAPQSLVHRRKDVAAVSRLLQVFGVREPRRRERHQQPPEYMLELYNATTGSGGITRSANPYNANLVRSFPDRVRRHNKRGKKKTKEKKTTRSGGNSRESQLRFFFNVTPSDSAKEQVLQAEFHLYKLKPKHRFVDKLGDAKSHLLEVRVYQALPGASALKEEGNRLLDVRRMTYNSVGWEVFYVKEAAEDWIRNPASNLGLLMTVRTAHGRRLDGGVLRFAKRHQGHANKQPILVLFSDDGRPSKETLYPVNASGSPSDGAAELTIPAAAPRIASSPLRPQPSPNLAARSVRAARASSKVGNAHGEPFNCARHEMYVDFEKIGWSSWIISPKGYNAYYCKGQCSFPLGQDQLPTNHATVQSIVNELSLSPGVGTPCCVPNKLFSISLLYFDENENVVLKQYDDMVAASCGCH